MKNPIKVGSPSAWLGKSMSEAAKPSRNTLAHFSSSHVNIQSLYPVAAKADAYHQQDAATSRPNIEL